LQCNARDAFDGQGSYQLNVKKLENDAPADLLDGRDICPFGIDEDREWMPRTYPSHRAFFSDKGVGKGTGLG